MRTGRAEEKGERELRNTKEKEQRFRGKLDVMRPEELLARLYILLFTSFLCLIIKYSIKRVFLH